MAIDLDERSEIVGNLFQDFSIIKRAITDESQLFIEQFDISMSQIPILIFLLLHGQKSMTDIASRLNISRGAATQLIDGLIGNGYVDKQKSDDDGRISFVAVNDKGREVIKKIQQSGASRVLVLLETLADDELRSLGRALHKLAKAVEGWNDEVL